MKTLRFTTALAAAAMAAEGAEAQGLPDMADSVIFVSVAAERGGECGHLADWEAAAVRAEARRALERFSLDERAEIREDAEARALATTCDDPAITAWIDATRPGIEREYLPQFLAAYRALADMETPPSVFLAAAPRRDYAEAIDAIDAKVAALDAAGARPEGGGEWDGFMTHTGNAIVEMAETLVSGERDWQNVTPDQAAAYMVDAGVVTELWLAAEGALPKMAD